MLDCGFINFYTSKVLFLNCRSRDIRRLFEYIEEINIKELCIEVEFYKTLNGILAFNQSLDPGIFREGNQLVYISSIKDPIKPRL